MRAEDGRVFELINPVIVSSNGEVHNITEHSSMCESRDGITKERCLRVRVDYTDGLFDHHADWFQDRDAICLQHFIDVMNGVWPCVDVTQVPILPNQRSL